MKCTAKSKQSQQPCKKDAVHGYTVCHIHGGKTPRGLALPQTKHGRYSKDMPTRLLGRYQEAQADPELLALRDDVSLLDARISDVLGRVDTGESGAAWRQAQDAYHKFSRAMGGGDKDTIRDALYDLRIALDGGLADYAAWQDVRGLLDQRRRLVESERKRLVETHQMISSERAMVLIAAVVDTVRRHVTDRGALAAISADIGKLITIEASAGD